MGEARRIKKEKQVIRRELRAYATDIVDYLKEKPTWMPWWLFKWAQNTAIHMEKIDPIAKLKSRKD